MAQIFAHGKLKLYLLSIIAEGPASGYDLIRRVSERFGGDYRPSAGTIYPRLGQLEREGLVERERSGRRIEYTITPDGMTELTHRESELDDVDSEIDEEIRSRATSARNEIQRAVRTLKSELAKAAKLDDSEPELVVDTTENDERRSAKERGLEARLAVQRADASLTRFRHDIRTALRRRAQDGSLDDHDVDALEASLAAALDALNDSTTA